MKFNKVLVIILLIGIAAAAYISWGRFKVEEKYKNYEITMDLEEVKQTAATEDKTLDRALQDWAAVGVNSFTITEASLNNLKVNNHYKVRTQLQGYDLWIEATKEGIDFIEKAFRERLVEKRQIRRMNDNQLWIEGKASDLASKSEIVRDFTEKKVAVSKLGISSKLEEMGLGFVPEDVEAVFQLHLPIRFRPAYLSKLQDAKVSIDDLMENIKKYSHQSFILFYGDTILGEDGHLDYLAEAMNQNQIALAMIETGVQREHIEQKGLKELVNKLDYSAIRAFSTWNYIQKRFDFNLPLHHQGEEIISTYYRAISERNIRLIFFRPFLTQGLDLISDQAVYQQRFLDLQARLISPHGISNVKEGESLMTMPYLRMRPAFQMLVALAVMACGLIILDNILSIKSLYLYGLLVLGMLPTALVYLKQIRLGLFNSGFALLATIGFAVLATQWVLLESKKHFRANGSTGKIKAFSMAVLFLLGAIAIALGGALAVTAFYASSEYLLEMSVFKGVKISQLMPIIIIALLAAYYFGKEILEGTELSQSRNVFGLLNQNIKIWHALVSLVILAAVALLLARSGHETGIEPSGAELFIRSLLEQVLPARPRNKAFLVGYPGLILLTYFAMQSRYVKSYVILAIMAVVGQANILNTFSHIRTPLYLSLWRIFFEIIFGLFFAVAYLLIIELGAKLVQFYILKNNEKMKS